MTKKLVCELKHPPSWIFKMKPIVQYTLIITYVIGGLCCRWKWLNRTRMKGRILSLEAPIDKRTPYRSYSP